MLGPLTGAAALGQSGPPDAVEPRTSDEPTVISVLTMAMDVAESGRHEAIRLPLRHHVALSMRKIGRESAFGDYVTYALNAWDAWDPWRESPKRKALRIDQEIYAEARRAFLAGYPESAKRLLRDRDCKLIGYCGSPVLEFDSQFLHWELEAENFTAATRRLREIGSKNKSGLVSRVARAFLDAGRAGEGFEILSELRSNPHVDPALIAQTYWRLGAIDEGRMLMREAANAAFVEAERDSKKQLPVIIAGVQWAMGEQDGALDTLRRIQQYDADRLRMIRAPLAGRLALVGLDADAFSLLEDRLADRVTLASIVVGQARRGDFNAAFRTFGQLAMFPAPSGEDSFRNLGLRSAAASIARNAARAGDADAFKRADAIRRELQHFDAGACAAITSKYSALQVLHEDSDTQSLKDLARAGQANFAIEHALTLPDLSKRVEGLTMIAEGLAGLADPFYDPLGFVDRW